MITNLATCVGAGTYEDAVLFAMILIEVCRGKMGSKQNTIRHERIHYLFLKGMPVSCQFQVMLK
jgi:hypothetical protein